jgi:hypothetical protein
MSRNDLALLTTSDLQKAGRHPRNAADAAAIRKELANRGELQPRRDTGTLSLFGQTSGKLPSSLTSDLRPPTSGGTAS